MCPPVSSSTKKKTYTRSKSTLSAFMLNMDRSLASLLQTCFKASLIGLTLLSALTWVPHICSCLRFFFLVSLPSVASAIVAPKCLFVFSNIIVVFLVSESKLSTAKEDEEQEMELMIVEKALDVTQESKKEQEGNTLVVVHVNVQTDQCEEEDTAVAVGAEESKEAQEEGMIEQEEVEDECKEETEERGLPADELNRRAEEFIARFNMERRLEARMLVCCC